VELPVERTWLKAADAMLVRHYGLEIVADDALTLGIDRFVGVDFRVRFFEAVGHQYVLALQRILTVDRDTRRVSVRDWLRFLEVNASTTSRWRRDEIFAGAQQFFAAHVLLLDASVGSIPLPDNRTLLRRSVLSLARDLRRRYLGEKTGTSTTDGLSRVFELMPAMRRAPRLVYDPFTPAADVDNAAALLGLARMLNDRPSAGPGARYVLPSEVKSWLDEWGIVGTLLTVGYRRDWTPLEMNS